MWDEAKSKQCVYVHCGVELTSYHISLYTFYSCIACRTCNARHTVAFFCCCVMLLLLWRCILLEHINQKHTVCGMVVLCVHVSHILHKQADEMMLSTKLIELLCWRMSLRRTLSTKTIVLSVVNSPFIASLNIWALNDVLWMFLSMTTTST